MADDDKLSELLIEFARTMVTGFPIQAILDHLVERIVEVLPITAAGVTLIGPDRTPHYIAASNESALRFEQCQTEIGEGPCLSAFESGTAVSVPDLSTERRFLRFGPAAAAGLAAVFTFPLRQEGGRLGALDLYRDTRGPLSTSDLATAQTLADVAAAYLINAQAREDAQERSRPVASPSRSAPASASRMPDQVKTSRTGWWPMPTGPCTRSGAGAARATRR